MSKKVVTNTWKDGLNKDLNPTNTPNTVLTDNLNGTYITYNGNEFSLQNDMGNIKAGDLSSGFTPIGIKEYGGIIYIISINTENHKFEIGSYPSLEWNDEEPYDEYDFKPKYGSFHNLIRKIPLDQCEKKDSVEWSELKDADNFGYNTIFFEKGYCDSLDLTQIYMFIEDTFDVVIPDGAIETSDATNSRYGWIRFSTSYVNIVEHTSEYNDIRQCISDNNSGEEGSGNVVGRCLGDTIDYNMLISDDGYTCKDGKTIVEFSTDKLTGYDIQHPVEIEIQPSYDGSVNVIFTDGVNPPRLINSGFAVLGNGKGKFIERNQDIKTNLYDENEIDELTRLIYTNTSDISVDLGIYNSETNKYENGVITGGSLKGGNYVFYFAFGDEDGNKTPVVAETSIISIFSGTLGDIKTISGTLMNEYTDKTIQLTLHIPDNYTKVYAYYTREYCDLNGSLLTETIALTNPIEILKTGIIRIYGTEKSTEISYEELNISYININSAKTIAQQQNMLFVGNVSSLESITELQNLSYKIKVRPVLRGVVTKPDSFYQNGLGYYDPQNIYYYLGYWPDEWYRFGVVYTIKGTATMVYDLAGCMFQDTDETNTTNIDILGSAPYESEDDIRITGKEDVFGNIRGVFRVKRDYYKNLLTTPDVMCFRFDWSDIVEDLQKLGITNIKIVRQKRIPNIICQGLVTPIIANIGVPGIKYYVPEKVTFGPYVQSFVAHMSEGGVYGKTHDFLWSNFQEDRRYTNDSYAKYTYLYLGSINPVQSGTGQGSSQSTMSIVVELYTWTEQEPDHCVYSSTFTLYNSPSIGISLQQQLNSTFNTPEYRNLYQDALQFFNYYEYAALLNINNYDNWEESVFVCYKDRNNKAANHIPYNQSWERVSTQMPGCSAMLSVETNTTLELQSMFDGSDFKIKRVFDADSAKKIDNYFYIQEEIVTGDTFTNPHALYIAENTQSKLIDQHIFATQVGNYTDASSFKTWRSTAPYNWYDVVKGNWCPYIALYSENNNYYQYIANIQKPTDDNIDLNKRAVETAPYYAVTNNITINNNNTDVYRGDCYINMVTIRMQRNFEDPNNYTESNVINDTWGSAWTGDDTNPKGYNWSNINVTDTNTVPLGYWVTFPCMSSINLALRSNDTFHATESSLHGGAVRTFYPLSGASTQTIDKLPESVLLNEGYGKTTGRIEYVHKEKTPFDKSDFTNRIAFSNVSVTDAFENGYRTFQGLSYQDYTKQYGQIVKILPWGNNLFVVFEHGLAIAPINEKALIQTTTEQSIHFYGHGVLPEQLSIISQDFGSMWPDSVIRTPVGIYGVDTDAKKIWRFSDGNGLELLSDMKIQQYLNKHLSFELQTQPEINKTNVKTHYNAYKGDVMFTFYREIENDVIDEHNLCFNERVALWITRYDWIPGFSVNVDNKFYTIPTKPNNDKFGLWKHGWTSGSKIKPSTWYGESRPFEFEFVVSDPLGQQKIFENLNIISNNVQPDEIEFEIVGDGYLFNKARFIYNEKNIYGDDETSGKKDIEDLQSGEVTNPPFKNAHLEYDEVLDDYSIVLTQKCKNKDTVGVRLGNIQYKEDGWFCNIEPLVYNKDLNKSEISDLGSDYATTRLRDKWVKIRFKYNTNKLTIINAVNTMENISYA